MSILDKRMSKEALIRSLRITFIFLVVINSLFALDAIVTTMGIVTTPTSELVPSSSWSLGQSDIYFNMRLDIPNWGLIPKNFNFTYMVQINNIAQINTTLLKFGQLFIMKIVYPLTSYMQFQLLSGNYLTYTIIFQITPMLFGAQIRSTVHTFSITGYVG